MESSLYDALTKLRSSEIFTQLYEYTDKSDFYRQQIDHLDTFCFTSGHLVPWAPAIKRFADTLRLAGDLDAINKLSDFTTTFISAIRLLSKEEEKNKQAIETVYTSIYDQLDQL